MSSFALYAVLSKNINVVYYNFSSKEDVLSKSFIGRFTPFITEAGEKLDISLYFLFYKENADLIDCIYKAGKQQIIIDQLLAAFGYSNDLPLEAAYSIGYFAYTFYSFLDIWYKRGMKETPEQMQKIMNGNKSKN